MKKEKFVIKIRLKILRDHLVKISKKPPRGRKFDLTLWRNACGTSACAIGEACYIPALRARGLKFNRYEWRPQYLCLLGLSAAAEFFGLTPSESAYLFMPISYLVNDWHSPLAVAARITAMLEGE
jgi:hypothetical protein